MKVSAIIPARGGSKGIPGKNIMEFCGKPLIEWSIQQAIVSRLVNEVYVTSDSEKILEFSEKAGAKPIKRPDALATDTSSSDEALIHALDEIERTSSRKPEAVVFLQATSPLRLPGDIDRAIELFVQEKADSLFSAARLEDCCVWKKTAQSLESITFDYKNRGRRQDREAVFWENGSIYVFRPDILREYRNHLGGRMTIYPMPFWQSYEIDSPDDVEICTYFMKKKILGSKELP